MSRRSPRPRIAVIGAGEIARGFHLPSLAHLAALGRCELAAICDLDQAHAATMARRFGAGAAFTDAGRMLDETRPDGVVVLTPVAATARIAGQVLRRGLPTLLEKPPGASLAECRQLIRAARAGRAANMVSFNRRFCPVLVQGRAAIAARGGATSASAVMYRQRRRDADFALTTGIHALDALRCLAGEIVEVETDRRPESEGADAPADYALRIGFASGAAGTVMIRPQAGVNLERYDVFGAAAVAQIHAGVGWLIDAPGRCLLYADGKPVRLPDPLAPFRALTGDLAAAVTGGFYGAEAAFVEALRGNGAFAPSIEESLPSLAMAVAVQAGRRWRAR